MAPPTSGGLTIGLILNMLEGDDLSALPQEEAIHRMLEASRLAYSDRGAYMGDADFVNVPVEGLVSQDYADERREADWRRSGRRPPRRAILLLIKTTRARLWACPRPPTPRAPRPPTSSPADAAGNAVSFTTTIESIGGSGIVVPGRGFLLNNELTDFSSDPVGPNAPEPFKRPRSSMSPTFVFEGDDLRMALGTPGGSTIITTVMQILLNVIDFDMTLEEALEAPRFTQRNTSETRVEERADAELLAALEARGHTFSTTDEIGAAVGIYFTDDGLTAVARPSGAAAARRGW